MKTKIRVLNKYLALETSMREGVGAVGAPRMVANPYELVKQERMLEASGRSLPLPRFGVDTYWLKMESEDLEWWSRGVRGLSREQIEPLDFSKPYDDELIKKLHCEAPKSKKEKIEINSDDLLNAELSDE